VIGSMIAREFFGGERHAAAGIDDGGEPGEDTQVADADQAIDDGGGFDSGGFDT
jgi:hypothetical protein